MEMIISTTGKGTRGVAKDTIVRSRHVGGEKIFALRDNTIVTGIALEIRDSRGGVVDERRREILNVMASSAIVGSCRVGRSRRLNDGIYTINHSVAICAGL